MYKCASVHLDHTFCAKQRQDQSEHCSYQLRMDKESETQKSHPLLSATGDDDDDDDGNSDEDDDDDDDFKEKLHASILSLSIKDPISPTSFGTNPRIPASTCMIYMMKQVFLYEKIYKIDFSKYYQIRYYFESHKCGILYS